MPGPSVFPSGEPGVSGDFWAEDIIYVLLNQILYTYVSSRCAVGNLLECEDVDMNVTDLDLLGRV